jgi:Protein of unknown function (DUF1566)
VWFGIDEEEGTMSSGDTVCFASIRLTALFLLLGYGCSSGGAKAPVDGGTGGTGGSGAAGGASSGVGGGSGAAGGTAGAAGGTAGAVGPGGVSGSGGMNATAGSSGAGGKAGAGGAAGAAGGPGVAGLDRNWAQWPMPNSPSDVAAGAPNVENYMDNGDGTVTDTVTGLMWQQTVPSAPNFTQSQAVALCPTLNLAGHGDWRLPSRVELVSIVDYGKSGPTINATYFPATPPTTFWSSSPVAGTPSLAWIVSFINGETLTRVDMLTNDVRCVRAGGSAPAAQYTTASGTVFDTKTKLTWQQTDLPTAYNWMDAKSYCQNVVGASLGGTGWRVPTIRELQTIVDDSRSYPSIDLTAFPKPRGSGFWSSSPGVARPSSADPVGLVSWSVEFGYGATGAGYVTGSIGVRCVR